MTLTSETWRPVPGYEPHYEVSDLGRVRSLKYGKVRILSQSMRNPNTYFKVCLTLNGTGRNHNVHHLVAAAFHGPRPDGADIRHLNGQHLDNRAVNLRYGTRSENALDSVAHGTHVQARKTRCSLGHPLDAGGTVRSPGRYCKTCRRDRMRARRAALST